MKSPTPLSFFEDRKPRTWVLESVKCLKGLGAFMKRKRVGWVWGVQAGGGEGQGGCVMLERMSGCVKGSQCVLEKKGCLGPKSSPPRVPDL